jgi:N-acetylglucosamine-6-phosphate deacetylase
MIQQAGVPLLHAVQMMTSTPARICKVDRTKGTLTIGKDADVIVFDEQISVLTTIVNGRLIINKL